jgi:ATP-dependent helicase/nuclease subunit B
LRKNEPIIRSFHRYYNFKYDPANDINKRRPRPKPPVDLRPGGLSATNIDLLNINPYDVYAKKILALTKVNPLEMRNIHAKIGTILHSIFEQYSGIREKYDHIEYGVLADLVENTLGYHFANDRLYMELYLDRVMETVRYFIDLDEKSRSKGYSVLSENWNECVVESKRDFTVFARIDRMEKLGNIRRIIDYKTGTMPSKTDVICGRKLQLLVEALIISKNAPRINIESLQYWLVRQKNGKILEISDGEKIRNTADPVSIRELIRKTEKVVVELMDFFSNESNGYVATNRNSHYSDFNHLSRLEEWLYGEHSL